MYIAIAYDPDTKAPRIYGTGTTKEKAEIQCLHILCGYLQQSPRWIGRGPFTITVKPQGE